VADQEERRAARLTPRDAADQVLAVAGGGVALDPGAAPLELGAHARRDLGQTVGVRGRRFDRDQRLEQREAGRDERVRRRAQRRRAQRAD
jgi:hypothetical protein